MAAIAVAAEAGMVGTEHSTKHTATPVPMRNIMKSCATFNKQVYKQF
jgi:hypothetical protein